MKVLAVDLGSKNVGLATCDELGISVSPAGTVLRKSNAALVEAIIRHARKHEAQAIVVGHPLNMDGTAGRSAKDAEKIAAMIAEAGGPPATLFDERLSSWEAENLLAETGTRRKKRQTLVHEASAAVILRSYLETTGRNP